MEEDCCDGGCCDGEEGDGIEDDCCDGGCCEGMLEGGCCDGILEGDVDGVEAGCDWGCGGCWGCCGGGCVDSQALINNASALTVTSLRAVPALKSAFLFLILVTFMVTISPAPERALSCRLYSVDLLFDR